MLHLRLTGLMLSLCALSLCGCVLSLNSLGDEKQAVFKPQLIGTWGEPAKTDEQIKAQESANQVKVLEDGTVVKDTTPADTQTWTFTKSGEKAYQLTIQFSKDEKGVFTAGLFEIDGTLYLQFKPDMEAYKKAHGKFNGEFCEMYMIQGFMTYKVMKLGNELQLVFWNLNQLNDYLEANPDVTAWQNIDGKVIFTAPTPQLRDFYQKVGKIDNLWETNGASLVKQ